MQEKKKPEKKKLNDSQVFSFCNFSGAVCGTLCVIPSPITRSFMSMMVHQDKQGKVHYVTHVHEGGHSIFKERGEIL